MAQLSAVAARVEEESSNAAICCREAKKACTTVSHHIYINLISNMNTDSASVKPCASKMNVFGHAKPAPAPASVSFSACCAEAPSSKRMAPGFSGGGRPMVNG